MIDVVPPDDTVKGLLPAQRQLISHAVRKVGGFRESATNETNANDVLFIMVLSLSLPLHLLEIRSLLQFHRGVWICRCLFASLSLSRMECCHVYTIYYMQIVLIFTSPRPHKYKSKKQWIRHNYLLELEGNSYVLIQAGNRENEGRVKRGALSEMQIAMNYDPNNPQLTLNLTYVGQQWGLLCCIPESAS